jgi:putative flippase GtrA
MTNDEFDGRIDEARSTTMTEPSPETEPEPDGVPAPPAGMQGAPGLMLRLVKDYRVAFLIVGTVNTVVGFLWFAFFDFAVGRWAGPYGYFLTLGCAHVLSVLCAFVLYRRFVFRVRGHVWRDLARFETVYLVALGVNAALLALFVTFLHFQPLIAQALIVFATTLISFFGHRDFSFRRPTTTPDSPTETRTH